MKIAPKFHWLTRVSLFATFAVLAVAGGACGSDDGGKGGGGGSDPAKYGFETDTQGWATPDAVFTDLTSSSEQKSGGSKSLKATFSPTAGSDMIAYSLEVTYMAPLPTIMPGSNATFHIYVPAGTPVSAVQPYINEGDTSTPQYRWTGKWMAPTPGAWQTIQVAAPADATPLIKVGVQFFASAAGTGPVYVDSVDFK